MPVHMLQPLPLKPPVHARPLRNRASQLRLVSMCNPHGIVSTAAQTPCGDVLHVEDLLLAHPFEDTIPKPIWTRWILWISRTIRGTGYFYDDGSPAATCEL